VRFLFDINHPAHVHYFKHCIRLLRQRGHEAVITTRDRFPSIQLLEAEGESYVDRGPGADSIWGKLLYMPVADFRIARVAGDFKPDVYVSFSTPYPSQVASLFRKPAVVFTDTENAKLHRYFTFPFSRVICTPQCFRKDLGEKQLRFDGYMELAYLHPRYFTPDPSVLDLLGIRKGEKYVIMRFVSWKANHDIGHQGITPRNKVKALREFGKYAKVFVTSEMELPEGLNAARISIPPHRMHDALAFASLVYGEGATMASEAAVLGTPAIFVNDGWTGYTAEEEERYGLVFNFGESLSQQEESIARGIQLLSTAAGIDDWQGKRKRLLRDKIDVTAFMAWFLENYPASVEEMRREPDCLDCFKQSGWED
jgi:predicted glycosyltransferase